MKNISAPILIAAAFAVSGCKHGPAIAGTWTTTNAGVTQKLTLGDDNSVTVDADTPQPPAHLHISGTYSLDKDMLGMKVTKLDAKASDPKIQSYIDANKQQILDIVNKQGKPHKIVWNSPDEFYVSEQGVKQTFTRVKS